MGLGAQPQTAGGDRDAERLLTLARVIQLSSQGRSAPRACSLTSRMGPGSQRRGQSQAANSAPAHTSPLCPWPDTHGVAASGQGPPLGRAPGPKGKSGGDPVPGRLSEGLTLHNVDHEGWTHKGSIVMTGGSQGHRLWAPAQHCPGLQGLCPSPWRPHTQGPGPGLAGGQVSCSAQPGSLSLW